MLSPDRVHDHFTMDAAEGVHREALDALSHQRIPRTVGGSPGRAIRSLLLETSANAPQSGGKSSSVSRTATRNSISARTMHSNRSSPDG